MFRANLNRMLLWLKTRILLNAIQPPGGKERTLHAKRTGSNYEQNNNNYKIGNCTIALFWNGNGMDISKVTILSNYAHQLLNM